jgi:hypothetical protein
VLIGVFVAKLLFFRPCKWRYFSNLPTPEMFLPEDENACGILCRREFSWVQTV